MDTNTLTGKTLELNSLIDYQEGAVVSRTIVDKKTGTITLFAFDKEQGLSEHTAPYDAFVYIVDGEAEVTISGKSLPVSKGEFIIMPANHPHSLRATQRFKMTLVMIRSS
ncbi:MAG TPA: cupin domain-containing protein [Dehalococcoidia bacterium]|jgi:quercetin dioxygenase-like cupin family protein|nr:cupin domain-containing protein [Dehalococcoidia bacterium]